MTLVFSSLKLSPPIKQAPHRLVRLSLALLLFALQPTSLSFATPPAQPQAPSPPSSRPHAPPTSLPSFPTGTPDALVFPTTRWASEGKPTPRPTTRPSPPKRNARPFLPPLPTDPMALLPLSTLTPEQRVDQLKSRSWPRQREVFAHLLSHQPPLLPALRKGLSHPNPRVQILSASLLSHKGELDGFHHLLALSEIYHDQAAYLLLGGLVTAADRFFPLLLRRARSAPRPRLLLQALSVLRTPDALPLWLELLQSPLEEDRALARQAALRYPPSQGQALLAKALQRTSDVASRAQIIRHLGIAPSPLAAESLLSVLEATHPSLRFLARLHLSDMAEALHKSFPSAPKPPPRLEDPRPWRTWLAAVRPWFARYHRLQESKILLRLPPPSAFSKVLLLYRTIHPLFGYGRMPLLIHDAANPSPKPPQPGKLWSVALPSKDFAELLQTLLRLGLFRLLPETGAIRDISVFYGERSYTLSTGDLRYFPFEEMEALILPLTKKVDLGLAFEDFYQRPDEAEISDEGQIGLWAFRKADLLPPPAWTSPAAFQPAADLESTFAALLALAREIPSRARLASLDMHDHAIRLSVLLFGSRHLSREVFEKIDFSPRFKKTEAKGFQVLALAREKIEQMLLDTQRIPIPLLPPKLRLRSAQKPSSVRDLLGLAFPKTDAKIISLLLDIAPKARTHGPDLYRISLQVALKDTYALLSALSTLASFSQGDRVLHLRLNPSGAPDRHLFALIAQIHLEMLSPAPAPQTPPSFLHVPSRPSFDLFQPAYR